MYLINDQRKDVNEGKDVEVNLDNPYNCLYCIILAFWTTVMIEIWKRRESEIAHLWNMTDNKGNDAEMPDYRAE